MNKIWILTLLSFLIFSSYVNAAPSPKEIMIKNEDVRKIDDVYSNATLKTVTQDGEIKVKQFYWWRKLTQDRTHFNTLTRFTNPVEVRGEGILFLEHENAQNEILMYLPAYKKIRRVESQQQSSSFMGSEFSYADIATPHVEDYQYKMIKEEPCVGSENAGIDCYVIETTPATDVVKERTGYSQSLYWVRKDNFMIIKGVFKDLKGVDWKTMLASEIKEVDSAHHKWLAHQVQMENIKNHHKTIFLLSQVSVNGGIADSIFTQANLSKER